jgi:hypothetical protein
VGPPHQGRHPEMLAEIEHDRLMIGDRPRACEAVPIHADR